MTYALLGCAVCLWTSLSWSSVTLKEDVPDPLPKHLLFSSWSVVQPYQVCNCAKSMKEALVIPTWVQSTWHVLFCVVDIMIYMSTVNVVCAGCVVGIMVYMSTVNVVCAGCVVDIMVYMATVNSSKET